MEETRPGSSGSVASEPRESNTKVRRKGKGDLLEFMLHLIAIGVAEMAGTATLMYIGCSAGGLGIHHNYTRDWTTLWPPSNTTRSTGTTPTTISPLPFELRPKFPLPGIDLCSGVFWGFAVFVAVQMVVPFSGGHLNPAISIAAAIMTKIKWIELPVYIVSQFIGAFLGFMLLLSTVKLQPAGFCVTVHNFGLLGIGHVIGLEFCAMSIVIVSLCAIWDRNNDENTDSLPLRIGLMFGTLFTCIGPLTGGSLNTARSFAPFAYSDQWTIGRDHFIYWVAPNLPAFVWPPIFWYFRIKRVQQKEDREKEEMEVIESN